MGISTTALGTGTWTVSVFTAALAAQTFHMIEHVAQLYQHGILGWSIPASRGLVFFLDFEWNHWFFNATYLVLLFYVFLQCKFYDSNGPASQRRFACYAFNAGLLVQGYHVIEHTVRIAQFLQTGCDPCKGILGWYFDGVYLHATLNTIVYALPLAAFFVYGFHSKMLSIVGRKTS